MGGTVAVVGSRKYPDVAWIARDAGNLTVHFKSDGSGAGIGFTAALEGSLCPGGSFSPTGRPVNGSCPGVCLAGYACPSGSTNGTAVACVGGTKGPVGLGRCLPLFYMENRWESGWVGWWLAAVMRIEAV